jgi:hypothetical protein
MNANLATKDLDAAGAEQIALIESQLARAYRSDHEAIKHLTVKAEAMIEECNKELHAICRKLKVPDSFAPTYQLSYYSRGETADKVRRAELRKAAQTAVAANVKLGKAKIERAVAKVCTALIQEGLTTDKAKAFLASMPTADALMPTLTLPELEQTRTTLTWAEQKQLLRE